MVPVALIPWWALEVEVGLSVKVSEFLMAALAIRHFCSSRFDVSSMPGLLPFLAYLAVSICAAIHTIEYGPEVPAFAGGGMMRNGYGRIATVLGKMSIFYAFLILVYTNRRRLNPFSLMKVYVYSCVVLAGLGLVQLVVFFASGIDIFPIGMFQDELGRSGALSIQGQSFLRVSSLGGEPKGLGQALAIAVCILHVFARRFGVRGWKLLVNQLVMLFVILLTASTSAFITVFVTGGSLLFLSRNGTPWARWQVYSALLSVSVLLVGIFYAVAATTDTLAPPKYRKFDSFTESMAHRITGRIRLDDTDSLIMESFAEWPIGLVAGRGLGTVHHYAHQLLPPHLARYMKTTIIPPKSGISLYLGNGGLLGVLLIVHTLCQYIPFYIRRGRDHRKNVPNELMCRMQALGIGMFAALFLRLYSHDIIWVTYGCMAVIQYQIVKEVLPSEGDADHRSHQFSGRRLTVPAAKHGSTAA